MTARYAEKSVCHPTRRNTLVRITWQDDEGKLVAMGSGTRLSLKSSTNQLSAGQKDVPSAEGNIGPRSGH